MRTPLFLESFDILSAVILPVSPELLNYYSGMISLQTLT